MTLPDTARLATGLFLVVGGFASSFSTMLTDNRMLIVAIVAGASIIILSGLVVLKILKR